MRRVYFAHPVSDFGTPRQAEALNAIEAFYQERGAPFEIVNPDRPEHQAGYRERGMDYFKDLVMSCYDLVFMRFPDGSIGAGVFKEMKWAAGTIREVHNGKIYDFDGWPGPVLSVEDTRAMLDQLTPSPQPRAALQAIEPEDEETMRQQKIKERRINIREGYGD